MVVQVYSFDLYLHCRVHDCWNLTDVFPSKMWSPGFGCCDQLFYLFMIYNGPIRFSIPQRLSYNTSNRIRAQQGKLVGMPLLRKFSSTKMFRDCKLWGPQLVMVLHDNSNFAHVLLFLRKYLLLFWNWFYEIFLVGFFWASCTILRLFVWRFLWWHFTLWNWTALILELFRTMVCVVNFIFEVFFLIFDI